MTRITLISRSDNPLAQSLLQALCRLKTPDDCERADIYGLAALTVAAPTEASCVYVPSLSGRDAMAPDLSEAQNVLPQCVNFPFRNFILLSSALIYGTGPGRQSLVAETYSFPCAGDDRISNHWRSLEEMAGQSFHNQAPLTILRPTTVLPSPALLGGRLAARVTLTLAGHDPVVQLLSLSDLAGAVLCAAERGAAGVFNVAPKGVVPLHSAVQLAGGRRIGLPRTLQRLGAPSDALEYLRYPWTVSNKKLSRELGFSPRHSSLAALRELRKHSAPALAPEPRFDEFGMDAAYIESYRRTIFKFFCDRYWRIEARGLQHLPLQGRAVLVGTHRGFMPWDGVMALHVVARQTGRYVRFLTHPGLLKFPFIANFITKLGGVVACRDSADRVLESNQLLGVFPEGVQGAFTVCRRAYQLLRFGRDDFAKLALRHRAPIIPFVTLGSAETFPIFANLKSRRWTRYSDWPCLPISTFPFLPLPLPSKWHTQFLSPIHVEHQYPPEAAQDRSLVQAISREVRTKMQQALDDMVRRRRSIFFGSIFAPEERDAAPLSRAGSAC